MPDRIPATVSKSTPSFFWTAGSWLVTKMSQLQISFGNALIAARGHGAPETTAAFARAQELSAAVGVPVAAAATVSKAVRIER